MELDTAKIIRDFVDYLMPELKPHETSVYIFLLTKSHFTNGSPNVRVGQRSMAPQYGRGKNNSAPARNQLIKQLKTLEAKGCIQKGDTRHKDGTLYTVFLPMEIPLVKKKLIKLDPADIDDFYTDIEKRIEIYERDNWICGYCGDKVTKQNATLDHIIPQSQPSGTHAKSNLRTACLMCNSIKSGKTEEEAAMLLLNNIRERRKNKLQTN